MNQETATILTEVQALQLPLLSADRRLRTKDQIAARLRQMPPYLVLERALLFLRSGSPLALLAEVRFPTGVCDGHYLGKPCVPLVDMGRAMDQAASLLLYERDRMDEQTVLLL